MITVDDSNAIPVFEQIRSQLSDQIRSGALLGGQRLPAIRQLAGICGLPPAPSRGHTPSSRRAGLIESSRTHGTRVRLDQMLDEDLRRAAARFTRIARRSSADLGDTLGLIRAEWTRTE